MLQADTIVYDAPKIARYQADSRFDYNSQLELPERSLLEELSRWLSELINSMLGAGLDEKTTQVILVVIFIVCILLITFFLLKKHTRLFMRSKKTASAMPYDIEEENIHVIDFDGEISSALNAGDYRLAVRLTYLMTLRILSDGKQIDWQIHKTPTEYLYEIKNREMKPFFGELTGHFLKVRYGNYKASPELFETMRNLRLRIKNITEGEAK